MRTGNRRDRGYGGKRCRVHRTCGPAGGEGENLDKAVANVHEPTPVTRIGPGLNGAVKPEFVAPGGNIVFEGLLDARRAVDDDAGVSTMSFATRTCRACSATAAQPATRLRAWLIWPR